MMTTVEKLQGMLKLEPVRDGETGVYLGLKMTFGAELVTMNMDAALHFLDALHGAIGLQQEPPAVMELMESVESEILLAGDGGVLVEDNPQPDPEPSALDLLKATQEGLESK